MSGMIDSMLFSTTSAIDGLPDEIEVLHTGTFKADTHGEFTITEQDLDDYVNEFERAAPSVGRAGGVDHEEERGKTRATNWVQGLRRDGNRLVAKVKWTGYGKEMLESGDYKFVSSSLRHRVQDKQTGKWSPIKQLRGVTLTNRPFLEGLRPIVLSDDAGVIALDGYAIGDSHVQTASATMGHCDAHDTYDPTCSDCMSKNNLLTDEERRSQGAAHRSAGGSGGDDQKPGGKMSDKIRSVLHLSDDATDEDIVAKIESLRSGSVSLDEFNAVKALAEKAQQESEQAKAVAAESSEKLRVMHRDTFLTDMIRQERMTPAELELQQKLYDVAPDETKAALEARQPAKLFSTVGHAHDTSLIDVTSPDGRIALQARAERLLAEGKAKDIGEAQILAERGI